MAKELTLEEYLQFSKKTSRIKQQFHDGEWENCLNQIHNIEDIVQNKISETCSEED